VLPADQQLNCDQRNHHREHAGQSGNPRQGREHQQAWYQQQGTEAALIGGLQHALDAYRLTRLPGLLETLQQAFEVLRWCFGIHEGAFRLSSGLEP